jgi:hypothetical protein
MYQLMRLLLMTAVLAGLYSVALLVYLGWPATGWVLLIVAFVRYRQRRGPEPTSLGSARWARRQDLAKAGMLDADRGLFLGRLQ